MRFWPLFHDSNIPSFHVGGTKPVSVKAAWFQYFIEIPRRKIMTCLDRRSMNPSIANWKARGSEQIFSASPRHPLRPVLSAICYGPDRWLQTWCQPCLYGAGLIPSLFFPGIRKRKRKKIERTYLRQTNRNRKLFLMTNKMKFHSSLWLNLRHESKVAGKKERGALPDNTNLLPSLLEPPAASWGTWRKRWRGQPCAIVYVR